MIRQTFYDGEADEEETRKFQQNESYMQSKLCLWLYTRYLGDQMRKTKSLSVGIDPGSSTKTLFNRHCNTDYSYKSMVKYPGKSYDVLVSHVMTKILSSVDVFMGLFERTSENCIQSVILALHPDKIPAQPDDEIQGKVITLHSTRFYDKRTAQIGKAFH